MRGSFNNHIHSVFGEAAPIALPEVREARERYESLKAKHNENQNLYLYGEQFNEPALSSSPNTKIQNIINGINALGLPLDLYQGTAMFHYWEGKHLETKTTKKITQYKLINDDNHILRFDLDERNRVHIVMYQVAPAEQGSWLRCKRFWHDQVKPLLLERCDFSTAYGRAVASLDHPVRTQKDWRTEFKFVGWDNNQRPLFIRKLTLFYLRLGFIISPDQIIAVQNGEMSWHDATEVHFCSDKTTDYLREAMGEEVFSDITKYDARRAREWAVIQRQRSKQINPAKAEQVKRSALASLIQREGT